MRDPPHPSMISIILNCTLWVDMSLCTYNVAGLGTYIFHKVCRCAFILPWGLELWMLIDHISIDVMGTNELTGAWHYSCKGKGWEWTGTGIVYPTFYVLGKDVLTMIFRLSLQHGVQCLLWCGWWRGETDPRPRPSRHSYFMYQLSLVVSVNHRGVYET